MGGIKKKCINNSFTLVFGFYDFEYNCYYFKRLQAQRFAVEHSKVRAQPSDVF